MMLYIKEEKGVVIVDIHFKEIELGDKPVFDRYFSLRHYENSEFTFTNMFIWRHAFNLRFSIIDGCLCIIGKFGKDFHFSFPPLPGENSRVDGAVYKLVQYFKEHGYPVVMKGVTHVTKKILEESVPGLFRYERDPNNDDYVYRTEDLIYLKGKKYHQKRNHINKFLKNYQYTYEPVCDSNIEECIQAELEWMENKDPIPGLEYEKVAVLEALRNFDALKLKGGALRIDGKIQAFSLGELLNPEMAVIHVEKANAQYHGCYAMINQQFAEHCWRDVPYINREEDMGIPGLRQAKKSYHPVKMVEKYTGYLLEE